MNKDEEKEIKDLIEYLDGELSADDHQKMQEKLESDEALQAKLNAEIEQIEAIRLEASEDIKRHLEQLEEQEPLDQNELKKEPKLIKLSWHKNKRVIWAAASVAFLLSLFVLLPDGAVNSNKLYEEYYEVYPNFSPVVQRGSESPETGLNREEMAMLAYEKGEYSKAETLLNELHIEKDEEQITFYLAQCLQQNNKHSQAVKLYSNLLKENTDLEIQIRWYKALAHIKLKQLDKAEQEFETLIDSKSGYESKAQELMKKIN